jgi:DNA polymerase-3 subunit epsilon
MREIILDTETTGLDPSRGDRLVEIGAIEIVNQIATGAVYHVLINPQREVPDDAYRVHGHSTASLLEKPVFSAIVHEFLEFIGDDRIVIHNAEFDMRFINAELAATGRPPISQDRVIDTLAIARRKHPGSANNLDALCDRYRIDRSRRVKHGALLDAEILVEVYSELTGGRQRSLVLSTETRADRNTIRTASIRVVRIFPLAARLLPSELNQHAEHIRALGDGAIWSRYSPLAEARPYA